jgi:hypothetical protein
MTILDFISGSSLLLIAAFTPIIVGLVALTKLYIDSRWAPLIAVTVGIILSIFFSGLAISWAVLLGLLAGLSAAGLYSGVKTTAGN